MTVQRPTLSQMKDVVTELGMSMSDARVQEFLDVMQGTLDAYDIVDGLPDYLPPVLYPRTSGYRPTAEENPMNAWYVKTEIKGAPRGPLLGRSVALKDNVCLAGVPMMNGASTLKGYTPDLDATIVTRLLDAGATIAGKAHCEYVCLSGGSHTNATGPVHNPHKHGYSAGGSSSGSGAGSGRATPGNSGLVRVQVIGSQVPSMASFWPTYARRAAMAIGSSRRGDGPQGRACGSALIVLPVPLTFGSTLVSIPAARSSLSRSSCSSASWCLETCSTSGTAAGSIQASSHLPERGVLQTHSTRANSATRAETGHNC